MTVPMLYDACLTQTKLECVHYSEVREIIKD